MLKEWWRNPFGMSNKPGENLFTWHDRIRREEAAHPRLFRLRNKLDWWWMTLTNQT